MSVAPEGLEKPQNYCAPNYWDPEKCFDFPSGCGSWNFSDDLNGSFNTVDRQHGTMLQWKRRVQVKRIQDCKAPLIWHDEDHHVNKHSGLSAQRSPWWPYDDGEWRRSPCRLFGADGKKNKGLFKTTIPKSPLGTGNNSSFLSSDLECESPILFATSLFGKNTTERESDGRSMELAPPAQQEDNVFISFNENSWVYETPCEESEEKNETQGTIVSVLSSLKLARVPPGRQGRKTSSSEFFQGQNSAEAIVGASCDASNTASQERFGEGANSGHGDSSFFNEISLDRNSNRSNKVLQQERSINPRPLSQEKNNDTDEKLTVSSWFALSECSGAEIENSTVTNVQIPTRSRHKRHPSWATAATQSTTQSCTTIDSINRSLQLDHSSRLGRCQAGLETSSSTSAKVLQRKIAGVKDNQKQSERCELTDKSLDGGEFGPSETALWRISMDLSPSINSSCVQEEDGSDEKLASLFPLDTFAEFLLPSSDVKHVHESTSPTDSFRTGYFGPFDRASVSLDCCLPELSQLTCGQTGKTMNPPRSVVRLPRKTLLTATRARMDESIKHGDCDPYFLVAENRRSLHSFFCRKLLPKGGKLAASLQQKAGD